MKELIGKRVKLKVKYDYIRSKQNDGRADFISESYNNKIGVIKEVTKYKFVIKMECDSTIRKLTPEYYRFENMDDFLNESDFEL